MDALFILRSVLEGNDRPTWKVGTDCEIVSLVWLDTLVKNGNNSDHELGVLQNAKVFYRKPCEGEHEDNHFDIELPALHRDWHQMFQCALPGAVLTIRTRWNKFEFLKEWFELPTLKVRGRIMAVHDRLSTQNVRRSEQIGGPSRLITTQTVPGDRASDAPDPRPALYCGWCLRHEGSMSIARRCDWKTKQWKHEL